MLTKIVHLIEYISYFFYVIKHIFNHLNYVLNTITKLYYCYLYNNYFTSRFYKQNNMKQLNREEESDFLSHEIQYVHMIAQKNKHTIF